MMPHGEEEDVIRGWTMRWRNVLLVSLVLALLVLPAFGAQPNRKAPKTEVSYPVAVASSPAFRDLPVDNTEVTVGTSTNRVIPNPQLNKTGAASAPEAPFDVDQVLQYQHGNAPAPSPLINFDGINNVGRALPLRTPRATSAPITTFSGSTSTSPRGASTAPPGRPRWPWVRWRATRIWTALGGQCASDNWGDPIVLWDRFRSRWVISQFSLGPSANGPSKTAIAVSKTADPTGAWWLYCYDYSPTTMNDYPKFGVWPDGYYYTCNQFLNFASWGGAGLVRVRGGQDDHGRPHGPSAQDRPGRREPQLRRRPARALRGDERPARGLGVLRGGGRQHLDEPAAWRRTPSRCGRPM